MNQLRVAVVGSRSWKDKFIIFRHLSCIQEHYFGTVDFTLVSGGASGADSMGAKAADHLGWSIEIHLPDWKKYGKAAGHVRNELIIKDADLVLAYWDGLSRGTEGSINIAKKLGKELIITYEYTQ
jgi:hypothetical protein